MRSALLAAILCAAASPAAAQSAFGGELLRGDGLRVGEAPEALRSPGEAAARRRIAIADRAFHQADLVRAEPLYRAAQADPDPAAAPLRAYATYRLGWIHLNYRRGPEAFASFAAVPALAGSGAAAQAVVRSARRDLARAFATYGAAADAHAALEGAAPGHGLELLGRLGAQWLDEARRADAAAVYRRLLQLAPADPRRCVWILGIAEHERHAGTIRTLVSELEAAAAAIAATRGQPAAARCGPEAHDRLYKLGEHLLGVGVGAPRVAKAGYAERLFAAFLRTFPGDPYTSAALYLRAEATAVLADAATGARAAALWRRAARWYHEAATRREVHPETRAWAIRGRDRARWRAGRAQ